MGRVDDLIAFLKARLDEDEAARNEVHRPRDCGSVDRDGEFDPDPVWCSCEQPARGRRDVGADRRLLAEWQKAEADPAVDDQWNAGLAAGLRLAVQIRAARHSDHPDYQPEWKP